MKIEELIIDNSNSQSPAIQALVSKVLKICGINPKEEVIIDDFDLRRVYLHIDGEEYDIRTWDIRKTDKNFIIEWTLFWFKKGESCGTRIGAGTNRFSIQKYGV